MSVYEYGDTTIFEATVHGHLENGPPITVPFPEWWPLRDEVYAAAREVVPYAATADFHLIYRHPIDGGLSRTRWVVDAEMLGPTLLWQETSGVSAIMFQLMKRNDIQQVRDDLTRPMPWIELRDLMPAVLAKQASGVGPVEIPYPGHDTMIFTPEEIQYSRTGWNDTREPYANPIYGWTFTADPTGPYEPALWIVPEGQSTGVKVSIAVNSDGTTWSDFGEPAPEFEPLPLPSGSTP